MIQLQRLFFNKSSHLFLQLSKRNVSHKHQEVVELSNIELFLQCILRHLPQLSQLYLTDLVRKCLSRNGYVTINLRLNVVLIVCCVRRHEINSLLASPVLSMHSCIDDQATSAEHFLRQTTKIHVWIFIHVHFFTQVFRIQTPSFNE